MKNDFRHKCNKENHFTDLLNTLSVQGIHIVVSFDFLSSLLEFFFFFFGIFHLNLKTSFDLNSLMHLTLFCNNQKNPPSKYA